MASLMASQTLILHNSSFTSPPRDSTTLSPSFSTPKHLLYLNFRKPIVTFSFSNGRPISKTPKRSEMFASCSAIPTNSSIKSYNTQAPNHSLLTGSTRTITILLAITLSASRLLAQKIGHFAQKLKGFCASPHPDELLAIQGIQDSLVCTVGPVFFAAVSNRGRSLNTPLTVVAAGMSKWLEIYGAVLMVRVLLSWFPNIPWDRQPLSAIRDLCDPYLNLFRNIIPPLFDTLDVSPLLAFAVLGTLAGILGSSRTPY